MFYRAKLKNGKSCAMPINIKNSKIHKKNAIIDHAYLLGDIYLPLAKSPLLLAL